MQYKFCNKIKENKVLRDSFNELARITVGFDFADWYEKGHWGDEYIPHVLVDDDKIISNVSVNLMKFSINEQIKKYIQLGTVMTHPECQKKGMNGYLINKILEMYSREVDGIYLFANDSVLEYYPKFGFKPIDEYEYYMELSNTESKEKYVINKVDMTDLSQRGRIYSREPVIAPVNCLLVPVIRRTDPSFVWLVYIHFNGDFLSIERFIAGFSPYY